MNKNNWKMKCEISRYYKLKTRVDVNFILVGIIVVWVGYRTKPSLT